MFAKVLSLFAVSILCIAALVVPQATEKALLFDGAQTYLFYTQSESSQAKIVSAEGEDAARVKFSLQSLTGESACYENETMAFAQAKRYGAKLVFTEQAADVQNYYYYSARLGGGVMIAGEKVNLQVAVRGEGAAVGYPLIFGGY